MTFAKEHWISSQEGFTPEGCKSPMRRNKAHFLQSLSNCLQASLKKDREQPTEALGELVEMCMQPADFVSYCHGLYGPSNLIHCFSEIH